MAKEVSSAAESGGSTSTAAANHQVEAEVGSQDKRRQKRGKYHHYEPKCALKSLSLPVRKR